jgi:hypothetical protein
VELGEVTLAFMDGLAALDEDGADAGLDEAKGGKESCGAGADDEGGGCRGEVGGWRWREGRVVGRGLTDKEAEGELDEDMALAGVNGTVENGKM